MAASPETGAGITLRLFTSESLKKVEDQLAEAKKLACARTSQSSIEDAPQIPIPNPGLVDGESVPKSLLSQLESQSTGTAEAEGRIKFGVALEEIDPLYENTFIVIGKEGSSSCSPTITRFNAHTLENAFTPFTPARRFATTILTHWIFRAALIGVILVNFLLINISGIKKEPELRISFETIFLLIYGFELIIKLIAKGFIGGPFTCASSFWFWLDLAVIIFGIAGLVLRNPVFIAFSGLRLVKIVPLVPSLKRYWNYLAAILTTLLTRLLPLAAALTFFFTILSQQLYHGVLTAKCVQNYTVAHEGDYGTPESRRFFYNSSQNWLREDWKLDSEAVLCGVNGGCPSGYVCVHGFGSNPDDNYTNFDSFSWALLSIFRTITQDYLEDLTRMIARVIGQFHVLFFFVIFFVISLPFLAFTVAVIAKYFYEYEDEGDSTDENSPSRGKRDSNWFWQKACFDYKFCWKPSESSRKSAKSIVSRPIFEIVITAVLILDVATLALAPNLLAFGKFFFYACAACKLIYFVEFVLKYVAAGGFESYISTEGNTLAFLVLPGIIIQDVYYITTAGTSLPYVGGVVNQWAFFRVLRLVYKWEPLRIIFKIVWTSLRCYWIVFTLLALYMLVFSYVGQTMFGAAYLDPSVWGASVEDGQFYAATLIPRWNFTDFWHSFAVIFRLLCAEWIETMWDCFTATTATSAGPHHPVTAQCYLYYLIAIVLGNFLVVCAAIGVVLTTIRILQQSKLNPRSKSNAQLICLTLWRPVHDPTDSIHQIRGNDIAIDTPKGSNGTNEDEGACWGCKTRVTKMRSTKLYHALSVGLIILTCLSFIPININDENSGKNPKYLKIQTWLASFFWYWLIVVEVPLKFIQFGCRGFFANFGNTFDLILCLAKLINVGLGIWGAGATQFLTSLECCRPFLLVDRFNRLRSVGRGLYSQARELTRFVLAGGFVWLIFGIKGIWLFAGYFYKCITPYEGNENFRQTQGVRISDCTAAKNFTWKRSAFNFDNIGESLQSLSLCSFFNGWIGIMQDAVDSTQINQQPIHEYNYSRMAFFFIFIIFGVFFLGNIVIGVFVYLLEQEEARLQFLSVNQRTRYKEKLEKLKESLISSPNASTSNEKPATSSRVPEIAQIPEPEWKLGKQLYAIVINSLFERAILGLIVLNTVLLSFHSFGQSPVEETVLQYLELIVLILFTIEMVIKILACRRFYFTTWWNLLDFILVFLAIVFTGLRYSDVAVISPSTFFAFRLFRLYRITNWENFIPTHQELARDYCKPRTPERIQIKALQEPKIVNQIYGFVTNFRFDAIIMLLILLDFFQIHFNLRYMSKVERVYSLILVPIIYYFELVLKLIAWRQFYFVSAWNVIDFLAVIGITLRRICGFGLGGDCAYVLCDVLLVVESLRIFRLLRFFPLWSYGNWKRPEILLIWHKARLQTFKRSLTFALPSMLNLLAYFVLVIFSFAFIGMTLFAHVKQQFGLNSTTNFATFTNSFLTLMHISTISGVDGAYLGIANTENCQNGWTEKGGGPNCGNPLYAKIFLILYCALSGLIFVNIYLALILETINQLSLGESNEEETELGPRSLVIRRSYQPTKDGKPIATIQYTTITTKTTTISKSAKNEEREFNVTEIKETISK